MAGHSQFKNIMHRKGSSDAVRSKMFSKLAREITVAAKLGVPDPALNPRLRLAVQNASAQSMPQGQYRARHQEGDRRRRRELRRGPLRGLWPGRRRRHRRGADRQPQPHRLECPLDLHQERRRAGRNRLGRLHVRPRRRDLLPGQGRQRRQGDGSGDRGRRRRRRERRGRPLDLLRRSRRWTKCRRRWKRRSARPKSVKFDLEAAEQRAGRRGEGRDADEADRHPRRRRRRAERLRQFRHRRRDAAKLSA